jgi:hypothetical protein
LRLLAHLNINSNPQTSMTCRWVDRSTKVPQLRIGQRRNLSTQGQGASDLQRGRPQRISRQPKPQLRHSRRRPLKHPALPGVASSTNPPPQPTTACAHKKS